MDQVSELACEKPVECHYQKKEKEKKRGGCLLGFPPLIIPAFSEKNISLSLSSNQLFCTLFLRVHNHLIIIIIIIIHS